MEFIRSHKLIVATIAIQLIALPLILFAVKERQQTTTKAVAATKLFFSPASDANNPISVPVAGNFSLDVMIDPGTNLVSLAKIEVIYDPARVILAATNPVVINSQVFPVTVEGPITSTPGKVQVVLSVGPDQTKVVQTVSKALTINFKAVSTTSQTPTTSITYGPNNALYSIAPQDTSNENVLSTTTPAVVKITADPTVTQAPTPTTPPTCTKVTPGLTVVPANRNGNPGDERNYTVTVVNNDQGSCATRVSMKLEHEFINQLWDGGFGANRDAIYNVPDLNPGQQDSVTLHVVSRQNATPGVKPVTVTLTGADGSGGRVTFATQTVTYTIGAVATPTPTAKPTATPTPTTGPTPTTQPNATVLNFDGLKLHGLGIGGDNPNPTSNGTLNPLRPNRNLTVEIYDTSGTLVNTVSGNITYSGFQTGVFNGSVTLPSTINSGDYLIKIKSQYYLRRQLPGFMSLVKGQSNNAPATSLIAGDVDNDNLLEADHDYNLIMDCYSDLQAPRNCDANKKIAADISDDGKVNYDDYNLFLRELSVQAGD